MCDYSLCGLPSRLAAEGEELVVHRFRTGSKGLAPPAELYAPGPSSETSRRKTMWNKIRNVLRTVFRDAVNPTVVCMPPGAQLIVSCIPAEVREELKIGPLERVSFVQTSAFAYQYRDALRFSNGREILVQNLAEGVRVSVVSLGVTSEVAEQYAVVPTP